MNLSFILPAYNEANRLPETLQELKSHLHLFPRPSEVIVVDDGSTDGTAAVVRKHRRLIPHLRIIRHSHNRGKGHAVATGMLAARGRFRIFTDADLPVSPAHMKRLLAPLLSGRADVAIVRRIADPKSRTPAYRRALSRMFSTLVQMVVLPRIRDSQCGCKAFTAFAAREIFSRLSVGDFCFDVNALLLAQAMRFRIREVAAPVRHNAKTTVAVWRDGSRMIASLIRIRLAARNYRSLRSRSIRG